ncbi:MAG: rhomboid family intramembrane serine protease, partial [Mucilaginibacter sp.]
IVYLLINIPNVILWLSTGSSIISEKTDEYLELSAFYPLLLKHFWTPVTYQFMHATVWHIIVNMVWLYWMGQIFEEFLGNKKVVGLYLMGGLTGALFFVLGFNYIPVFANSGMVHVPIVGASAAVMAILIATATLLPDYTMMLFLIGPVRLKWLAVAYVIIDFLMIAEGNPGGEISHLGGALFGFIYIKQLQRGNDMVGFFATLFKKRSKLKVAAKGNLKNAGNKPRQEDVDHILDKISQTGYESLSKQEKEILFRASKDNEG